MSAQPVNPNLPPDHVTVFIDGVEMAGTLVGAGATPAAGAEKAA